MATLFCGGLAVCNAGALASWAYQWEGLCGTNGITPLAETVADLRLFATRPPPAVGALWTSLARQWQLLRAAPSLFMFLGAGKREVHAVFALGFACATTLAACAIIPCAWPDLFPVPPPLLAGPAALIFAAVYLSFTALCAPWLSLQFETLLVEANAWFGVLYLLSPSCPTPWVYAMRWLAFRLMLGAGAGKLSGGDPAWRDGRAMKWHYETQPLPNPLSRTAHRAPAWWHALETRATFFPEGIIPAVTFWAGRPWLRHVGFLATAAFNTVIALTGNYGHLHLLTVSLASTLLVETDTCYAPAERDHVWRQPRVQCASNPSLLALPANVLAWTLLAVYVTLSLVPLFRNFEGLVEVRVPYTPGWDLLQRLWRATVNWHVVGAYNLFAHMTRARWELEYEVSADGGVTWWEVGFAAKPGGPPPALDRTPPHLWIGHIPRLDWRLWFLPLAVQRLLKRGLQPQHVPAAVANSARNGWHRAFMMRLLQGSLPVLALLRFPSPLAAQRLERGLTHVRCMVYAYRFSDCSVWARATYGEAPPAPGSGTACPARVYGQWEVGSVWRRKFVCVYDAVARPTLVARAALQEARSGREEASAASPGRTPQARTDSHVGPGRTSPSAHGALFLPRSVVHPQLTASQLADVLLDLEEEVY